MLNKIIDFFLVNRLVTALILVAIVAWGLITSPFGTGSDVLPSDPVPVDAIPDIGENQQIVFTSWPGRSPQDIEDQVSYPLTTYLLGIPGVSSVRSSSIFGFSSIYIIFDEEVEFYWSRSRILEKLASIPPDLLPDGVQPTLGPDATALGQVFWYTIEGRDADGNPTGGWDLSEIRSIQDFYVKYALSTAEGVSEVASIGGFVKEYQVDVDPDRMRIHGISLEQVIQAVRNSNLDVGAKTMEINQAEYLVRGLGYIEDLDELEEAVVTLKGRTPVYLRDVARVSLGPAERRGLLDKEGAEVVGGVVVARYGANPMAVIQNVKDRIEEVSGGLPVRTLDDGTESQLTIVPFYDRSGLIKETLGTLEEALTLEILITFLVVIIMVLNLRASVLISSLLPVSVLMVFIAMRYFGVDANIVALSGIAIAIGTMVDLGVILTENVIKHLENDKTKGSISGIISKASAEVAPAILTAVATTIISFIPVFTMEAAEGKLFRPLAFTKTFALIAALIVSLFILPAFARWFFGLKWRKDLGSIIFHGVVMVGGIIAFFILPGWTGWILLGLGISGLVTLFVEKPWTKYLAPVIILIVVCSLLSKAWLPLGAAAGNSLNLLFVVITTGSILGVFLLLERYYERILRWCMAHRLLFISFPIALCLAGATIWLGFDRVFGFVAKGTDAVGWNIRTSAPWSALTHGFPGTGKEFMPSLDEGSFLLMPTSMPHSGIEFNRKVVGQLDMLLRNIPEVEEAVGKLGRVNSALDPAPISMFENVINYKPEYMLDEEGRRQRFSVDAEGNYETVGGKFVSHQEALLSRIGKEELVYDEKGQYFRNWRENIQSPDDIWQEILRVSRIPGVTSAPKLQPIETRLVMLQTGMRAPMGIKVYGPELELIEEFAIKLEEIIKQVPSVKSEAVFADRIVGKPYINLEIDRTAIARYGLTVADVQKNIMGAIGGIPVSETVEGRERYSIRVRYPRELRNTPEKVEQILINTPYGSQIPLGQFVDIRYVQGPQAIKSEDTFLLGYVLFDKREGYSEVSVVEDARAAIEAAINRGALSVPAGLSYKFAGSYENQVRAEKRLGLIIPAVLLVVFLILYLQFRSVSTSLMIFSGILLAFSGGFILIWCYGQEGFLDLTVFGTNIRDMFSIKTINLSVAVWVGFIALFGIATDNGVLMATYLDQQFRSPGKSGIAEIRVRVVEAGKRRIRPALMTAATTMIALLPVLSSTGRGSDIMVPMAIPSFGGMALSVITVFLVPVLYGWREELKLKRSKDHE